MELTYRLANLENHEVRFLYETAFPEDERPPYEMALSFRPSEFYGIYEGNDFVGLADIVPHDDLVYLFFLAIASDKRGKGYGSRILAELKERYRGKRIFLLAEELDEKYADLADRKRRFAFYRRNGFLPSGILIKEYGVVYEMLTLNGAKVSKQEFLSIMALLIGEEKIPLYYEDI